MCHAAVPAAQVRRQDHTLPNGLHGDPARGSLDADRARDALVPRGLEGREDRAHRLRAPVRAHDVQGQRRTCSPRRTARTSLGRRPEQRLHRRGHDRLLANGAGAVSAADAVARGRPDGDRCASRKRPSSASARWSRRSGGSGSRTSRTAGCPRSSTTPRSRCTRTSTRSSAAWPTSRRRASRTCASSIAPTTCPTTRRWSSPATSTPTRAPRLVEQEFGKVAEAAEAPCRATSRRSRRGHARNAGHGRGGLAAAGGGRRLPDHLRRPPGLVSAAHRRRRCCPTARARASTAAGVRAAARALGVRAGQPHRAPEPVLCRGDRATGAHARGRSRTALIEEMERLATEPISARELERSKNQFARDYILGRQTVPAQGGASWRTPSCCTRATSRPPTASSTSSRT